MASQELSLHLSSSQRVPPLNAPHALSTPLIAGNSLIGIFESHVPVAGEAANALKLESKRVRLNEICMRGMTLVSLFRDILVPFEKTAEREQLNTSIASLGALRQHCVEETFNTTLAFQKYLNTAASKYDFMMEDLKAEDLGVLNHPSFRKNFTNLDSFKDHLKVLKQENPEDLDLQQKVLFALSIVYQQKIARAIRSTENPPQAGLQDNYERLSVLIHELAPLNLSQVKQSASTAGVFSGVVESLINQVKQAPIDNLKRVQFFDHHFPNQEFKSIQKEVMIRLLDSEAEQARQIPDKLEQSNQLYGIALEFLKLKHPEGAEKISTHILNKKARAQVMVEVMHYFIEKGDKASAQRSIPKIADAGMRQAAKRELSRTGL